MEGMIRRQLRLREKERFSWKILRHSVDARKKPRLYDIWSVGVFLPDPERENRGREKKIVGSLRSKDILYREPVPYSFPEHDPGARPFKTRPVVVGMGPAGLFCAIKLTEAGYAPILLERGAPMEERVRDVEAFWRDGNLKPNSNIQFGEGGAGTFSDGKLTTNVRDRAGRNEEVARIFISFGAPPDIAWENLPHIGTDLLRKVIVRMREYIVDRGGEVRFGHCVKDLVFRSDGKDTRELAGLLVEHDGETYVLNTEAAVLAPGHSSRDLVRTLCADGIPMIQKNFAVGVRLTHPQAIINHQQYGISEKERESLHLPAVSYKLTARAASGRGVYSFCMCPGGYIVNASSQEGYLAVNGMSNYARDSARANSAIVITVGSDEFGSDEPLAGLTFQEHLEKKAWELAGGRIPVEKYPDFASAVQGEGDECTAAEGISLRDMSQEEASLLCLKGQASWAGVHTVLPVSLACDLVEGMRDFGRKIPGFDGEEAIVAGLESRTSSPVRIERNEDMESTGCRGLYPCGEGAGYAGGITSAAIDGIKTAEAIAVHFLPKDM